MRIHPLLCGSLTLLLPALLLLPAPHRGLADTPTPPPLTKAPHTAFECRWAGSSSSS
jgi:hypothetical protein